MEKSVIVTKTRFTDLLTQAKQSSASDLYYDIMVLILIYMVYDIKYDLGHSIVCQAKITNTKSYRPYPGKEI